MPLVTASIPTAPSEIQHAVEKRQYALTKFEGVLRQTSPEQQQRIFAEAVRRISEPLRERELDVVRHERFGRTEDAERSRGLLQKMQRERDVLLGLQRLLQCFEIDLWAVLAPAFDEARTHVTDLDYASKHS